MADDQSQRPYRASEPPPARGSGKTGSDPLAELARLIGQTDPFGEFGRDAARRSPPSQSVARADWNQPLGTSYTAQYSGDARAAGAAIRGGRHLRLRRLPRARSSPRATAVRITGISAMRLNHLPRKPITMKPSRDRSASPWPVRPSAGFLRRGPRRGRILRGRAALAAPDRRYGDRRCRRFGGDWHRRRIWLSRAGRFPWLDQTTARDQGRYGTQQDCSGNDRQGCPIQQIDHRSRQRTRAERKAGLARRAAYGPADSGRTVAVRAADGPR